MPDAVLIAVVTGVFGLVGKLLDVLISRSKPEEEKAKHRHPANIINPITPGGILNPATVGFLALGVIVGFLVVPRLVPPQTPTIASTEEPTAETTVEPTQAAAALELGGEAQIHTTGGDALRIHDQPDFNAPIVARLDDGTQVTLIDGPVTVGTDRWWKIQMSDGSAGWAVETVEGVETLQPVSH